MAIRVVEALGILLAATGVIVLLLARGRGKPDTQPPLVDTQRRAFLNRVMLGSLGIFALALGGGSVALLWPTRRRGFGSKIVAGKVDDLHHQIEQTRRPVYNGEGHFYVVKYSSTGRDNRYVREGVVAAGLMALYQKCSHLGCRVPFCTSSQWFECPCHDARFNGAGEWKSGPAPAGMWRFPVSVSHDGWFEVDTARPLAQPLRGVDTTNQQPAGSFCVRG